MKTRLALLIAVVLYAATSAPLRAQPAAPDPVAITKIDPPNWWADLPRPMLLLEGQHLDGAGFTLSRT